MKNLLISHLTFPIFIILVFTIPLKSAQAGFLITSSAIWKTFSMSPKENESTPKYFGYGFGLNLGYSFLQRFDLAAFGSYIPSKLDAARIGKESVQFFEYGGEIAFRFSKVSFLSIKNGRYLYRMLFLRDRPSQIDGLWRGPSSSFSLGTIFRQSKETFWQVTIDLGTARLNREDADEPQNYRLDSFGFTVSFVLNTYNRLGSSFSGSLMRSFGL